MTSQIIVTAVFACLVYGLSLVMGFFLHGVQVSGHSGSARYARVVAAVDDSDRIDQPIGAAHFTGCSVVCEHDGGPRDSWGLVRLGH